MPEYRGCELPEDLWYDLDYLWARPNDDGTFTLGLTDPAQTMAGRVVSALFRKPGTHRAAGRNLATLESGKWVGGVPAPFDGTIERINPAVAENPGMMMYAFEKDHGLTAAEILPKTAVEKDLVGTVRRCLGKKKKK